MQPSGLQVNPLSPPWAEPAPPGSDGRNFSPPVLQRQSVMISAPSSGSGVHEGRTQVAGGLSQDSLSLGGGPRSHRRTKEGIDPDHNTVYLCRGGIRIKYHNFATRRHFVKGVISCHKV